MKQLAAVAALVTTVVVVTGAFAASSKDYTGPSCNNLVSADGSYATVGTEAILRWDVQTESPTCKQSTYTLYVLQGDRVTPITQAAVTGGGSLTCPYDTPDGPTCVSFTVDLGPAANARTAICIYGTSASGSNVRDRAPDAPGACTPVVLDTSGSNGGGG